MKSKVAGTLTEAHILKPVLYPVFHLALAVFFSLSLISVGAAQGAEFYWNTTFNLSEEYDDNIFLEENDKTDDFITLVSQDFTLGIRTQDLDVGVDFSIGYAYYKERGGSGDIRGDINLSGARDIPLSDRLFLTLDESFRVTEDPIEFGPTEDIETATEVYSSRRTRNRYYRNLFRGELAYRFGEEDDFYWGYRNTLLENSNKELQDSMIHNPYAGIRYWFAPPRHGMDIGFNYTMARFDDPVDPNDPRDTSDFDGWGANAAYYFRMRPETTWNLTYSYFTRDFDSPDDTDYQVHNVSMGVSHQFTETFSGSAGFGWYWQNPEFGESTDGPNANVGFSKQFENGTLSLQGSWGFREQYAEVENLGATEFRRVRATYGFQAAENLNISMGLGYYDNEYLDARFRQKDKTWYGNISMSCRLLERLTANLNYTHQDRRSGAIGGDYKVNRVMLKFSIPYQGRPRPF